MQLELDVVTWHVRNRKEFIAIKKLLDEYSTRCTVSKKRSMVPKHVAILVDKLHAKRAGETIKLHFGRRCCIEDNMI